MPIYGYRCGGCAAEFELSQRMTAPTVTECTVCGATARRVIYPPAIVFKGSGFYKTDSRSGSAGSESKPAATPATKDGTAAKPATPATKAPAAGATAADTAPGGASTGATPAPAA